MMRLCDFIKLGVKRFFDKADGLVPFVHAVLNGNVKKKKMIQIFVNDVFRYLQNIIVVDGIRLSSHCWVNFFGPHSKVSVKYFQSSLLSLLFWFCSY